tara:strand:- start:190 stop:1077 length:888 start_codon:yes stop_codon:yes gene_type:complete
MNLNIAIVALTRGYPDNISKYNSLILRNNSIYENINQHRENPADIILFHEGNISESDQSYVSKNSNSKIIFKNVSKYFNNIDLTLKGEEKFSLGYRQMCRFNMFHIWNEVSEYDYVLRVDEDIEINKFNPMVFEYMELKKINYMTGRFTKDTHRLTNETLPFFLKKETKLNVEKVYNHRNPYTNLYASSVKFWKQSDVQTILKKIALSDEQIRNRWGDHTVQGIILNHKNEKIKLFKKLEYNHDSHNLIIKNNILKNLTINSKYNPISVSGSIFQKIKLKIKGKIKSENKFDFDY